MFDKIKLIVKRKLVSIGFQLVKKNPDALNWGVIGLGNMAEFFSTAIHGDKDALLTAVASRSFEKAQLFAARHGKCKYYKGYDVMLKDSQLKLDIIYIATPVKYHYQIIKDCLLENKNVLCEKPITSNATQLKELMKIAKDNNCFLMEGMWMKCLPTFQKANFWINDGEIGEIELIKADFYKKQEINLKQSIFNVKEDGGVLKDFGVYAIAFMTAFLKELPLELNFNKKNSSFGIDADWHIFGKNKNCMAFVNISSNFSGQSNAAIIGSKGSIEWASQFNRTNTITLYDQFGKIKEKHIYNYSFDGFEYELKEVRKSLKENRLESKIVPLQETLNTLIVMDKLYAENNA
jgi:predicted dehydrogenase